MHILIGLAIALALFYFWLIGHWFARVLVFLILAVIGFCLGAAAVSAPETNAFGLILFGLLGAALAWPIAGLPVYYWRWRLRQMLTVYR